MDPISRKALLAIRPAIFKALADVLSNTAANAEATSGAPSLADAAAEKPAGSEQEASDGKGTASKTKASSTMLKSKRLKPLLGCVSVIISADDGAGSLAGLAPEARKMRASLETLGEASASLPMQRLCGKVAEELDVIGTAGVGHVESKGSGVGDERQTKVKRKDRLSPKDKRKVQEVYSPVGDDGHAPASAIEGEDVAVAEQAKSKSSKKKKKKRESTEG